MVTTTATRKGKRRGASPSFARLRGRYGASAHPALLHFLDCYEKRKWVWVGARQVGSGNIFVTKQMSLDRAFRRPEIGLNSESHKFAVIIDVDTSDAETSWALAGLLEPSMIVANKRTGRAHLVWFLRTPVGWAEKAHAAPKTWLREIHAMFVAALAQHGGDAAYGPNAPLTHNPLYKRRYRAVCPIAGLLLYDLSELSGSVKSVISKGERNKAKRVAKRQTVLRHPNGRPSRNIQMFVALGTFACGLPLEQKMAPDLADVLFAHVSKINHGGLTETECRDVAKSVAGFTAKNPDKKTFRRPRDEGAMDLPACHTDQDVLAHKVIGGPFAAARNKSNNRARLVAAARRLLKHGLSVTKTALSLATGISLRWIGPQHWTGIVTAVSATFGVDNLEIKRSPKRDVQSFRMKGCVAPHLPASGGAGRVWKAPPEASRPVVSWIAVPDVAAPLLDGPRVVSAVSAKREGTPTPKRDVPVGLRKNGPKSAKKISAEITSENAAFAEKILAFCRELFADGGLYLDPAIQPVADGADVMQARFARQLLTDANPNSGFFAGHYGSATVTGRVCTSRPGHLHGVPKNLRRYLRAAPGKMLLIADFSAFEPTLMAFLTGDPTLRAAVSCGDFHMETAKLIFGAEITDARRGAGKLANLALSYGAQAKTLARMLSDGGFPVTMATAKNVICGWHTIYPVASSWIAARCPADGLHPTIGGRIIPAANPRTRVNYPVQTSGADVLFAVLAQLRRILPSNVRLVLQAHDEIVLECDPAQVEAVGRMLTDTMALGLKLASGDPQAMRLRAELFVGETWEKTPATRWHPSEAVATPPAAIITSVPTGEGLRPIRTHKGS